jgi:uncharacterized protein (TIGR00251 family)
MERIPVMDIKDSKTICVIARPNSSRNQISGYDEKQGCWLINIKAVPEKGKANQELLKFLRKETGKSWRIKSGLHCRKKILEPISS